jgi:hypothetical protein
MNLCCDERRRIITTDLLRSTTYDLAMSTATRQSIWYGRPSKWRQQNLLLQSMQTNSDSHTASYSVSAEGYLPGDETAEA